MVEKMVENRVRWFGRVERRPIDYVARREDHMEDRSLEAEEDLEKLLEKIW